MVLWSDGKLQIWLHWCWGSPNLCIAKAEQDVPKVHALGEEELGFAKILDAVLAFEAGLDPLNFLQVR